MTPFQNSDTLSKTLPLTLSLLLTVSLAGCDLYGQDDYVEQFVVESYLIAREAMPEVRISTTAPFDENYYFDERAVLGAEVLIHMYDEEGEHRRTFEYTEDRRGVYRVQQQDILARVQPRHTYRLDITLPRENDHRITAVTSVPDTFSVQEVIRSEAYYQSDEQLEFRISRNRTNGRQNYFIYATEAMEPVEENLTPFWQEASEEIDELIRIRTNIVNEENFDLNPDGTLTLRMPWIGIAFYGKNIISTYSIDDNAYDFFRSQPVQAGGGPGTLAPGEIQNILYNIDGAIGLFGSMSVLNIEVDVKRPPSL
ncbi:MAG: DUF4249 family protein [Cyclonatronaceae bacterium]